MTDFDCIVVGAGPAGLAAAALLAQSGKQVALVTGSANAAHDPRTVALMRPSINLLAYLDLWPGELQGQTAPLRRLRLVDDMGAMFAAPELLFDAAEIGDEAFGWNLPLSLLVPALMKRATELGVHLVEGPATAARHDGGHVSVQLAFGSSISALIALAADGRNSLLREAAGIATEEWSYDQVAIATSFAHSQPHRDISTEYHRPGGPFTTVPMRGARSSLVWMERPRRAAELMALTDREFASEIQVATHGELGLVSDPGPRKAFEMKGLAAREFGRNRILLIGEAAHVVPPIGAQGLNMSLRDAAQAADLIQRYDDPGFAGLLKEYNRLRQADVRPRRLVIDLMNRSLLSGFLPLQGARAAGLSLIAQFGPLRRFAMQAGLGKLPLET